MTHHFLEKPEWRNIENICQNSNNLEYLGIDWKIDRVDNTIRILEENGYHKNDMFKSKDIKSFIFKILEKYKKGTKPSNSDMSTIRSNIDHLDHHDLVRTDQILTMQKNENETEYQWGSVVMNFRMKTI